MFPLASAATVVAPEPVILWALVTDPFSMWFKYNDAFVAIAFAFAVELAPTTFCEV